MRPKLVAIAGPLQGASFPIAAAEIWIGRDPMNHICLSDPIVSRRHCVIKHQGADFQLCDPDSANGTFVNDVPVREKLLFAGDHIKVGDSIFLFLLDESGEVTEAMEAQLDDGSVVTSTTVTIDPGEAFYLHHERVVAMLPTSVRVARDLNALLKVSNAINQVRKSPELQRELLQMVFEVVPAEFGAIVLAQNVLSGADSIVWQYRDKASERERKVSRTVVDRVMREGTAILSNDLTENLVLTKPTGLIAAHIQSLLAVPLAVQERVIGVLYLDSSDAQSRFDEDHLQLATAIAAIAAVALEKVQELESLEFEAQRLRAEIEHASELIGDSEVMRKVYRTLAKVASTDSTVLLLGESGTGKELAARAIHRSSSRFSEPFIAINCAGLSETLLESDLFGHEKGSFTGATSLKKGKFEIANGGTIFLDEIGELPTQLQAKLLRALQTREFERVGGTRSIKVDVRIIAATNRELEAAVKSGGFRADLYYRLNVVSITMPPLRERRDDVPLLVHYFIAKFNQKCKRQVKGVSSAARAILSAYDWPGNVRELENTIERAIVLGSTEMILPEDLPAELYESSSVGVPSEPLYQKATREAKKQLIRNTLEQTGGNFTEAAGLLGLHPSNLHRLVRNLGLRSQLKK